MELPKKNGTTYGRINGVFADLKWLIVISLLFAMLLHQPDQIRELYRATTVERRLVNELKLLIPLLMIAGVIWFGTFQILTRSLDRMAADAKFSRWASWLPPLLGALPLFACAIAFFVSIPELANDPQVNELYKRTGSRFKELEGELAGILAFQLRLHAAIVAAMGLGVLAFTVVLQKRMYDFSRKVNETYFHNWRFLGLTVLSIAVLTACILIFPVGFPQAMGVFGIVAAFAICVTAFTIHFTLLTIDMRIPFIPIFIVWALLLSYWDRNDNHSIRTIPVAATTVKDVPPDVRSEFVSWFESRPDRAAYSEEYPVYIVAAQGGGIYAAYQTAVFLARLQDLCSSFSSHLFAISSVSGGSVGAATFVAALNGMQSGAGAQGPVSGEPHAAGKPGDPCPSITRFLQPNGFPPDLDKPGTLETAIDAAMSADFLSPLIAAMLFPDFSQRFLPHRFSSLDRARALEFAIEDAVGSALKATGTTLLDRPFSDHWNPKRSSPALVMNTTDVASGRRVLIAPFEIETKATAHSTACSMLNLARARPSANAPAGKDGDRGGYLTSIRLSTAAVMSARFPWVTPAATVHVDLENTCLGKQEKVRLVDGGYVDNSGVETALALIDALKNIDDILKARPSAPPAPKIRVHLIALSGGGFPTRTSFSLGETLEPIRALLSARESRAYVALDRASRSLPKLRIEDPDKLIPNFSVELSAFRQASLGNRFYPLPLGWAMSAKTREIIGLQSGRFWDCQFDARFAQWSDHLAETETDCVQLLIYHELNQSLKLAVGEMAAARYVQGLDPPGAASQRLNHDMIVECYDERYRAMRGRRLFAYQRESVWALLRAWDSHPWLDDNRWLAYILGTAAVETGDFRVMSEFLHFNSAEAIVRHWKGRFRDVAEAEAYVNNPEKLADRVYQGMLGNTQPGDGWRYRGRGILQLVGRENYSKYGKLIEVDLERRPDLVLNRDISARVMFAYFFPSPAENCLAPHINESKDDWEGARKVYRKGSVDAVTAKSKMFLGCIEAAPRTDYRHASL